MPRSAAEPSGCRGASRRRSRAARAACLALWAVWGAAACAGEPPAPSVLLISVDTLRADHLGAYGHPRPTSPFLDALAREGVQFLNAHAVASWTLPSHMSLMTSLYPQVHGVESDRAALAPSVTTLARELQRQGYTTVGFVSWIYVSKKFGFHRGFDRFEEFLPPPRLRDSSSHYSIKAGSFVDRVLDWAQDAPPRPFFLFLHLFDPHINYEPPLDYARLFDPQLADVSSGTYAALRPFIRGLGADPRALPPGVRERAEALYDGEIRYIDTELQRLFEVFQARGLLENTLVVFTSDHGEEFGEHGSMEGHGWTLYDEVTHVPLLIRFPDGAHSGVRIPPLVQLTDVAPTILDWTGGRIPDGFQGRSLLPVIRGEAAGDDALAFSHIRRFNLKWAVQSSRHKLIYTADTRIDARAIPPAAGFELYDLVEDPAEQHNIYDESSPVARDLAGALRSWAARPGPSETPRAAPLTPEERERLRGLGYLED